MKNFILIIFLILITVISALFFAQNDELVVIDLFYTQLSWQMNWVLISMIIIGFLIGVLSMVTSLLGTKIKLSSTVRKLALLEKEIENLRSLPLKDNY